MKYILFLFILIGCSENNHTYFPLGKIKSWSYKIEIEPEVDKKTVYKKTNLSLGKKKLEIEGRKESFYPFLSNYSFAKREFFPGVISSHARTLQKSIALLSERDFDLNLDDLIRYRQALEIINQH